jgi:hypothetical protein
MALLSGDLAVALAVQVNILVQAFRGAKISAHRSKLSLQIIAFT